MFPSLLGDESPLLPHTIYFCTAPFRTMFHGCSKDKRKSFFFVEVFSLAQARRLPPRHAPRIRLEIHFWDDRLCDLRQACICTARVSLRCFVDVVGTCDSFFFCAECLSSQAGPSAHILSSFCVCRGDLGCVFAKIEHQLPASMPLFFVGLPHGVLDPRT
jgi:hypothetical protein